MHITTMAMRIVVSNHPTAQLRHVLAQCRLEVAERPGGDVTAARWCAVLRRELARRSVMATDLRAGLHSIARRRGTVGMPPGSQTARMAAVLAA